MFNLDDYKTAVNRLDRAKKAITPLIVGERNFATLALEKLYEAQMWLDVFLDSELTEDHVFHRGTFFELTSRAIKLVDQLNETYLVEGAGNSQPVLEINWQSGSAGHIVCGKKKVWNLKNPLDRAARESIELELVDKVVKANLIDVNAFTILEGDTVTLTPDDPTVTYTYTGGQYTDSNGDPYNVRNRPVYKQTGDKWYRIFY